MVIENVGISAYIGAAPLISDPAYLSTAASILTTEARHNAWVSSAVRKQAAWAGAFDSSLSQNQVSSIAGGLASEQLGICANTIFRSCLHRLLSIYQQPFCPVFPTSSR